MALTAFFQWLKRERGRALPQQPHRKVIRSRRSFVPRMEALEDRTVPTTFTVMNLNDSGTGSLRATIAAANAHPGADTIAFTRGLSGTIHLSSGELSITDSVTINGPGANQLSVSGNDVSRVFELATSLNVTINGLTITHGHALDEGGGILNDGSNLTLSGDNLDQNITYEGTTDTNGAQGGGLASLGGTLNISACNIVANQAVGGADATASGYAVGGGIYLGAGSATIGTSTISDNFAQGGANSSIGYGLGGGLYLSTSATITDSTVSGNRAQGGANSGGGGGGGGLVTAASTTMSDCTLSDNSAVGGAQSTSGPGYGGGIASYSTLTITVCNLSG